MSKTGNQYMADLHELRERMWREAQEQGLSLGEYVDKMNRECLEEWESFLGRPKDQEAPAQP